MNIAYEFHTGSQLIPHDRAAIKSGIKEFLKKRAQLPTPSHAPFFQAKVLMAKVGHHQKRGSAPSTTTPTVQPQQTAMATIQDIYPDGSYCAFLALDTCGDTNTQPLTGAVKDAIRLKQHLCKDRNFECIGNLFNHQATNQNIRKLFSTIKSTLQNKPNARFVLFVACHTVIQENEAWLCTYNFNKAMLEETALEITELRTFSTRNNCKHQLLLLDSCHTGMLFMRTRGGASSFSQTSLSNYERTLASSPSCLGISGIYKLFLFFFCK